LIENIKSLEKVIEKITDIESVENILSIDPILVRSPYGEEMRGFLVAILSQNKEVKIIGVTGFLENTLVFLASQEFIQTYVSSYNTLRYDENPLHRKCLASVWPKQMLSLSRIGEIIKD
ncbi:MAG: hypothetical protein QXL15_03165, partial [Candidatus Korarchaeota archaeon]